MWRIAEIIEGVADAIDVVSSPRFYIPVFVGIAIAFALWRWMMPGDTRDVLVGLALLGGVVAGFVWDWGK